MYFMKKMGWCIFLTLFVFAACGDQVKKLEDEGKIDDALVLLDRELQQYPTSMKLLKKKYGILWRNKRYEECLQMINDTLPRLPAEARDEFLPYKQPVLMELAQVALKKKDNQAAIQRLEEMAHAGYRGFHQLRHSEIYQPVRSMPKFKDIMKKIEDNTGIGQPARDFTVTLTSGETYRLSEQKGKVVLVDFWSTHCPPCIEEIPNLKACYQAFKDKGFEIVSISLDYKKEELETFLAKQPMPWKTVFSGKGWGDDTALLYKVYWIPSLWLVDREGILRYFDVRGEDLKAAITLLANK